MCLDNLCHSTSPITFPRHSCPYLYPVLHFLYGGVSPICAIFLHKDIWNVLPHKCEQTMRGLTTEEDWLSLPPALIVPKDIINC